uniref:Chromo domain-containing protein n=1 Tax=Fagus sylvatica TaxID=28930 RepID=A0A2N9J7H4_FAGSY
MGDERVETLANEVANLASSASSQQQTLSSQQQTLKEIQEMMAALHTRLDHMADNRNTNHGENSHSGSNVTTPPSWICRAEQFFSFQNIPMEDRQPLAAYHLEGEAQLWYQLLKSEGEETTWNNLKEGLLTRYGLMEFADFFGDLTKLNQTGNVREYQSQFERLLSRVDRLSPPQQVGCFTSGLKDNLRVDVQALKPTSLSAAVGLARLYEAKNQNQKKIFTPTDPRKPITTTTPNFSRTTPINTNSRRLNPTEIRERREKGLCFNCDEKFGPGHRCKKLFFIEACLDEEQMDIGEEDETDEIQPEEMDENLSISLHAIAGTPTPQTMRVKANVEGKLLVEEKIPSNGRCPRIRVALQGTTLITDFYLLPLEGFDAVLGAQWLATLGPILWDFSKMSMRFHLNGREVEWKGLTAPTNRMIDEGEMKQEIQKERKGILLQLFALTKTTTTFNPQRLEPCLQKVLTSFSDIFKEPKGLPPPRSHDHRIPLTQGSQPISVRPYRYPHFQKAEIERLVEEMLGSGVIRSSTSPYSSPVILVKKHDGSWRLCIDYRALNQITIKDKFPIPVIDELLDELHGARYFSKLDLRSGYHQIRMYPEDIPKTAFRTHQGHYEFLVMPFGLTNAPSTFQSLMNEIFKQHLRKFVLVFFDDILIYSRNGEEHLKHVSEVLSILRKHKLYAKKEKCQFGQDQIKYLGHVISTEGVAVDPEKVCAMVEWPKPKTLKALRGFLGLTGYYRKFIQGYGKIAGPLTSMLKKDSFIWSLEAEKAFEQLKQTMTQAPVLALPDFTKPFIVECDASGTGIGGVLMQNQKPIAFISQALQGRNLAMSTYDKEMLALVLAVQKWRPYLMGRKFIVRTDHKSLKYLWEQKITTIAQQRWLSKLMGYDFVIEYKRGSENLVADALSRREDTGELKAISQPVPSWIEPIKEEVQTIPRIAEARYAVSRRRYMQELMRDTKKQYNGFGSIFYWKGMKTRVKEFIRQCDICQRHKVDNLSPAGLLQPLPIPTQVWSDISMDFIDGLPTSQGRERERGREHTGVQLSRRDEMLPCVACRGAVRGALRAQLSVFLRGGGWLLAAPPPSSFSSLCWWTAQGLAGLTPGPALFTSSRPKEWARWIPWAQFCYNSSVHSSTKKTPFEVVYGRKPPTLLSYVAGTAKTEAVDKELLTRDEILKELRQNIQQAQVRMKQNADKHRRDVEFAVGDWVVERVGAVAYKLKLPAESKLHSVFHVSNLKRKLGSQEEASTLLPVIGNSDGLVPLPQAILDRRTRRSKEEVLVHWQGLSPSDATWEDAQSLRLRFPEISLEDKGAL